MDTSLVLVVALIAMAGLLNCLAVAITVRKGLRAGQDRRRARLEARARPALLELLAGAEDTAGAGDAVALPALGRATGRTFEQLAAALAPKLRGADRAVLVGVLEQRGTLAAAQRRTRRPGAVGRARAAELLGAAGAGEARDDLLRLLEGRNREVRAVATRALGRLGDPVAVPALLHALDARRGVPEGIVTMALAHLGPAAIPGLRVGLDDPLPRARAVAAELLGLLGALGTADALLALFEHDPDGNVRLAAAHALGRLGLPRAAPALATCLREAHDPALRVAAARALGEIGTEGAVSALESGLEAEDLRVARSAAGSLAACGGPGHRVLEAVAADGRPSAACAREALAGLALRQGARRRRRSRR